MPYRPFDAFEMAKHYIKKMPLEDVQPYILDAVHSRMWTAAPWRWTLGTLPVVTLAQNAQTYPISLPSDFLYAISARLLTPDSPGRDLEIVAFLPTDAVVKGQPSQLVIEPTQYRVSPVPASVKTPAEKIVGVYKKKPVQITKSNMSTPGVMGLPDEWFWVYELGVLAYAYLYADDQRSGSVQMNGNQMASTGMFGHFEAGLNQMRIREKLPQDFQQAAQESKVSQG